MQQTNSQQNSHDYKKLLLPSSIEAEKLVLGSILQNINNLNIACDILVSSDFYEPNHIIIFTHIQKTFCKDESCDVHLVSQSLKDSNELEKIGGISYLVNLCQFSGISADVENYSSIVKRKSVLRQMIAIFQTMEGRCKKDTEDAYDILEESQKSLFKISQSKQGFLDMRDILDGKYKESKLNLLAEIQMRQEDYKSGKKHQNLGYPTHFLDLDKLIGGIVPSNLIILAARPAMGKTAMALCLAENLAYNNSIPVGIFSLEMTADQLTERIVCSRAEVEAEKIKNGSLNGDEYQRVVAAVNSFRDVKIFIDESSGVKITDLRSRARRMKEAYNVKVIIIDYLQLISGSGSSRSFESRQNEISEISRYLKILAKELNIAVLCLSQLSRKVEERNGHKPILSDLRDSGAIEQDSDQVMFLFRPEYYDKNHSPGMAELIVAKNRHGAIGTVDLVFSSKYAKFQNYHKNKKEDEDKDPFNYFSR